MKPQPLVTKEEESPLQVTTEGEHLHIHFHDDALFKVLCGVHDENLALAEYIFTVTLVPRGNHLMVMGDGTAMERATQHLRAWYEQLSDGRIQNEAALRKVMEQMKQDHQGDRWRNGENLWRMNGSDSIRMAARSRGQAHYIAMMEKNTIVFALGAAGSGKTYLAVAYGAMCLLRGDVERLVLARPAVEAGERLGFLPGDVRDKIDPYLRPLYDCLREVLTQEQWRRLYAKDAIEVAPLAFMRGRTLNKAFVILDEGQNATSSQMRMCLTRLGEGSRMVVTADPSQIDLPRSGRSAITEAQRILQSVSSVAFVTLTADDVMRHPVVRAIVAAYQKADGEKRDDHG